MATRTGERAAARRFRVVRRIGMLVVVVVLLTASSGPRWPPGTEAATASSVCPIQRSNVPSETGRCMIRVGGVVRAYLLTTPAVTGRPRPLVVAFHGLHQTAGTFAAQTGLVTAARAAGLVLALPESVGPAFNDGRLGKTGPDDDTFTLALISHIVAAGLADPGRVVVTGFSNGAGMAMEVAGAHPHAVAALVSIDGSLIDAVGAPRPTGPVRAYLVHGTADPVQPWLGRRSRGQIWPAYIPVPATVAQWVRAAGAGPETVERMPSAPGAADVTVSTWAPGAAGADVVAYTVAGMGHVWPVARAHTVDATGLVVRVATSAEPTADRADDITASGEVRLHR